mmetsp:Transcript_71486/g.209523  ORF Transcript_71486/g.209523 Transcript_71486/m.209523 type:complete len:435 (+) Transcript_71486:175-1479(+)
MAASGSCFLCNAAYSPVWRRDKATGQTICNRCYRNPAPEPSLDALSAENLFDDNDEFALSLAEDRPSNGSTEDRTRKKRKHRERGWSEGGEGAGEVALPADMDLSTPAVETDTEYPAVDLETAPRKLHVQSSGSSKLDGSYWRMAGPSRGRPCYAKWTEKKPMYLFWNRKWFIGWDFGSAKSYAQLKDAGVLCPCEPYPKVWKVLDKHERKEKPGGGVDDDPAKGKRQYSDNLAMRVIDAAVLELAAEEGGVLGLLPSQEAKATRRSKHEAARTRPDRSVASSEKVPASASETRTLTAEEKAEQDALNAASSSDEDRPAVAPAEGSDEDSASDSSSEESSSSASASSSSSASWASCDRESRRVFWPLLCSALSAQASLSWSAAPDSAAEGGHSSSAERRGSRDPSTDSCACPWTNTSGASAARWSSSSSEVGQV